jgi:hypothetical protein
MVRAQVVRAAAFGAAAFTTLAAVPAGDEPPRAASVYSRAAGPQPPGAAREAGQGAADQQVEPHAERIIVSAMVTLGRVDSFSARLRQKVRIGDRVLVGTGRYVQSGRGEEQRFRSESSLTCDSETFEILEVSDGLFCWTYRRNGPDPATLQRIDVRRVRERLEQLKAPVPEDTSPYLGGLQRTLGLLRDWFFFTSVDAGDVEGVPVWHVTGHWRPDMLAAILPAIAEPARRPGGVAPAELPDGVPWSVRISVGREDLVVRRVEWLAIPGPRPVAAGVPEPIAVLELLDVVVGGAVDAGAFFYQPASLGLMDVTEQHVKTLVLMRP